MKTNRKIPLYSAVIASAAMCAVLMTRPPATVQALSINSVEQRSEQLAKRPDSIRDSERDVATELSVATVAESAPAWAIPEDEYHYIERIVMAEAGNQSELGQMAVAQCIAETATEFGKTPYEVVTAPKQYTKPYSGEVSESVKSAVQRVFVAGERAVEEKILYFYSLATGRVSRWHERQTYVLTIEDHKFFR